MTAPPRRIAIVGAGPAGLEAALLAAQSGYEVDVFERGRVAESVRDWGHVRLFSPFGMNASPWALAALGEVPHQSPLPNENELLTGREFAERYLLPLSRLPPLTGRIHENREVVAIGRAEAWKRDLIGSPARAASPFRLLLRSNSGEQTHEAEVVLDCSGTYPRHAWMGAGGIPCIGEATALAEGHYRLPDVRGRDRQEYAGRRTLVVGSGYSAATAVVALAALATQDPKTHVIWLTRTSRNPPVERIADDELLERDRLGGTANQLAAAADGPVEWRPACRIECIERLCREEPFRVRFEARAGRDAPLRNKSTRAASAEEVVVDRIIANVGYRPNRELYEELQVHECYASQAPMNLAAELLNVSSNDCLSQSTHGAKTLRNPEPGFFILGSKSYGRDSRFLMRTGIEQIREVFSLLEAE